ncbi:MAG: thiamine pyrophosphate-dependent dehydrogenase E1 component subunit alpha, partial [Ferruginibacter sp.]
MAEIYEANRPICKYVHSTSRGHEAIQLATALNLLPCDYISPYYRDESIMLGLGFTPLQLMLQLLAKAEDIFTGGKAYYNHPNYRGDDKPTIIHQSSATGMQVIPTTGIAQGIQYLEKINSPLLKKGLEGELPVVICSLGDASVTEGEVSEAFQFAALHQLPIIYLIQDNEWGISVSSTEARTANAYEFIEGFKGINRLSINGSDFAESYSAMQEVIADVRIKRRPWLIHAKVPLLGHHTSGVRIEFYRTEADLAQHLLNDPGPILRSLLLQNNIDEHTLQNIEKEAEEAIKKDFDAAVASPEPNANTV